MRKLFAISALALCVFAFGCKRSSSTSTTIAVSISSPTSTPTIEQGQSVVIVASVANDSSNDGVTWQLNPSSSGTLANATTTQVTYVAPTSVAAKTTVSLIATSIADVTKNTTFSIQVTPPIQITLTPNITGGAPVPANGGRETFNAALNYDENSAGVSWALSSAGCAGANSPCGTLVNSTTTSVQYVAPVTAPTPDLITLTATSVADKTQFSAVSIVITAPAPISVSIAGKISSIVTGGAAVQFTATTQNDPNNAGVTWSIVAGGHNCQPACGTLSNATTTSVTYTPPSPPPPSTPNSEPTLIATSVTDSTRSDSDTFMIEPNGASCVGTPSGNESLLNQHYAFWLQGWQGSGNGTPVAIAASIAADGAGNITGGEMDINNGTTGPQHVTINAGSTYSVGTYSTDPGNHACMILATSAGSMTFRLALGGVNAGVARSGRIIEFDDSSGSGTVAAGIFRIQNTTQLSFGGGLPSANFTFGLDGLDSAGGPISIGGSFALSAAGGGASITNGFADIDDAGTNSGALSGGTGQISVFSASTWRATATFSIGSHAYKWAIYAINPAEFFIVEIDALSAGSLTSGRALATGNSFNTSSLSGNYIFHQSGIFTCNNSPCPRVNLGLVNFSNNNGNGALNGQLNQYDPLLSLQQQSIINGTYTVTANSGRVVLAQPSSTTVSFPVLYLVSPAVDGISAFIVGTDSTAMFGLAEFQPSGSYTAAGEAGNYDIGTEDPRTHAVTNTVGTLTISQTIDPETANVFGTADRSGQSSGLVGGGTVSGQLVLTNFPAVDGTGNGTGYIFVPAFAAITNGSKIFYIDTSSGQITIIEAQ